MRKVWPWALEDASARPMPVRPCAQPITHLEQAAETHSVPVVVGWEAVGDLPVVTDWVQWFSWGWRRSRRRWCTCQYLIETATRQGLDRVKNRSRKVELCKRTRLGTRFNVGKEAIWKLIMASRAHLTGCMQCDLVSHAMHCSWRSGLNPVHLVRDASRGLAPTDLVYSTGIR